MHSTVRTDTPKNALQSASRLTWLTIAPAQCGFLFVWNYTLIKLELRQRTDA